MADLFDPHAILATETLVPTEFAFPATRLGRDLDPSCDADDLPEESKVELPLWLAEPLVQRGMVGAAHPKIYAARVQRKMEAGAQCMNIRSKAPYFYTVGMRVNQLRPDAELAAFLQRTFKERYHDMLAQALAVQTGEKVLRLEGKLSEEERALYTAGRHSINRLQLWLENSSRGRLHVAAPKMSVKAPALPLDPQANKENIPPQAQHAGSKGDAALKSPPRKKAATAGEGENNPRSRRALGQRN